MGTNVGV